jgi:hypothetical protein
MSKVVRAELAAWPSVVRAQKLWVAQTEETVARAAISGLWLIETLRHFWLFVIIRIVAPKTVSTAKEKIFMVDAVRIWSLLYPKELLRAICIAVKSWLTS